MGKKVDLNKKRATQINTKKINHNQRPINVVNISSNNNEKSEQNSNNLDGIKKGIAKAALKANGLPPQIADYASEHPEQTKKLQGFIDVTKPPTIVKWLPIICMGVSAFFILMIFSVLFPDESIGNSRGLIGFGGMYAAKCPEITVIFTDKSKGYEVTGTGTYPLEDYVAGVVYGELFKLASNEELAKTYAIAARTFGLRHVDDNCTIESSDKRQVYFDITEIDNNISRSARAAAEATAGHVLIKDGELYPVQYDAFCSIAKDDNYYTIKQKNQKIPVEWVERQGMNSSWLECTCAGNHGRGMSTYGGYYLASELGYKYDEILNYYYGDDGITISTNSFIESIAGLEIKDTTKAKYLQQPIKEFLNSKGSSLENLNSFIYNSVQEKGAGTRAGVVTAAVSMINYLYDNFNIRLPYYWGGSSGSIGLPSSFGTYSPSAVSRGGNINYYRSFDCSGFVSWAIKNGGYNFSRITTSGFDSQFSKNGCNITDQNCIGQPGDLINSRSGHVELIIAVDQENGKYFIAHSGGPGVVMMERNMHTGHSGNYQTKIIFMEEFYNNPLNVNPSY